MALEHIFQHDASVMDRESCIWLCNYEPSTSTLGVEDEAQDDVLWGWPSISTSLSLSRPQPLPLLGAHPWPLSPIGGCFLSSSDLVCTIFLQNIIEIIKFTNLKDDFNNDQALKYKGILLSFKFF